MSKLSVKKLFDHYDTLNCDIVLNSSVKPLYFEKQKNVEFEKGSGKMFLFLFLVKNSFSVKFSLKNGIKLMHSFPLDSLLAHVHVILCH